MEKIGLIAGSGSLPPSFLENARLNGYRVYTLAVGRQARRRLAPFSEKTLVFPPGKLEGAAEFFVSHGVKEVVMLGQVLHYRLLRGDLVLDDAFRQLFSCLPDRRAATILRALIGHFESFGLQFKSSAFLLDDHFLRPGFAAGPVLSALEEESVALGRRVALALAGLDVGLTVAVKDGIVLSLEAVEGTNLAIRRAGRFARGIVVVKVCRPDQDPRFDLPVIGPTTIRLLEKIGGRVLAFSAGTLVVEREKTVALAEKNRLSLVTFDN